MGIMEKKMETTGIIEIIQGLYRGYMGRYRGFSGEDNGKMETAI